VAHGILVSLTLTASMAVGGARAEASVGEGPTAELVPPAGDPTRPSPTDTWEVDGSSVTEVQAYLEHLYQVQLYLRAQFLAVWGPVLDCIADVESSTAGGYQAQSRRYSGRYQFAPRTADYAVRLAGHGEYAGTLARTWPDWAQDAAAVALIHDQGDRVTPAWRTARHCNGLVP
jgi:hypothetical protein